MAFFYHKRIKTGSVAGLFTVYCFTEVRWEGEDVKTQTHSFCTQFNLHTKIPTWPV